MTYGLVTSSRYSPGNMTPEALEDLFIGRENVMDDVITRISSSVLKGGKHFLLLLGPRGSGKTHLVALARHRLSTDPKLLRAKHPLRIAYLNEEEWGVASFLDLLVRILEVLREGHDPSDPFSAAIEALHETYTKNPDRAQRDARALLVKEVGQGTLLLICENLADILDSIGDEGQHRWRALIQEKPFWTILATTPRLSPALQSQEKAFYGFFTLRHLGPIDFEGACRLLQKKARAEGNETLASFIGTPVGRARVRAIHHLAAGNHRVYVTMSRFLTRQSLDDLAAPFLEMVDELTPYYQSLMAPLPPQQRKIAETLCRHASPMIVKDVALHCMISQQTAAKQLGEVAQAGLVRSTHVGRNTYYEIAEPLQRICIEVKDNRAPHLRLLTDFLRHWFTAGELSHQLRALAPDDRGTALQRAHFEAALRAYQRDHRDHQLEHLAEEGSKCIEEKDWEGLLELSERGIRENDAWAHSLGLLLALLNLGRSEDVIERGRTAIERHPAQRKLFREILIVALMDAERDEEALAEIDRATEIDSDFEDAYPALRAGALIGMGRYETAVEVQDEWLSAHPDDGEAHVMRALALAAAGREPEAERALRNVIRRWPKLAEARTSLASVLYLDRRYEEALAQVERALELEPDDDDFVIERCKVLLALARFDEVLADLDGLSNQDPRTESLRLCAFQGLGRYRDARESLRELSEVAPADELAGRLTEMFRIEILARGSLSFARELRPMRSVLESRGRSEVVGMALTGLISEGIREGTFDSPDWLSALPKIEKAVEENESCVLPLRMLTALVRSKHAGDETALLGLPLEQRELIEPIRSQAPAPDAKRASRGSRRRVRTVRASRQSRRAAGCRA